MNAHTPKKRTKQRVPVDIILEAVRDVKVTFETITWHRCVDVAPIIGETVLCAFDLKFCAPGEPQVWVGYRMDDNGQACWYDVAGYPFTPVVTHWARMPIGAPTVNREGHALLAHRTERASEGAVK